MVSLFLPRIRPHATRPAFGREPIGCASVSPDPSSGRKAAVVDAGWPSLPVNQRRATTLPGQPSFPRSKPKTWAQLFEEELEEPSLVFAYLADIDLVITRLQVLADGLLVAVWVGAHEIASATVSSVTSSAACSKCLGNGSSWLSSPGTPVVFKTS